MRLRLLPPILVLLALAAAAPSAGASTKVGLDFGEQASGATCEGGAGLSVSVPKGVRDYTVPASAVSSGGGVITAWGTSTGAGVGTAELKVFRTPSQPKEPGARLIVGQDGPRPVAAHTEPVFTDGVRIPVQAGDMIGLAATGTNCEYLLTAQTEFLLEELGPGVNPAPGFEGAFVGKKPESGLQVTAFVEPDEDGDGFGDESQDGCPRFASSQVPPCPVVSVADTRSPQLTVTAKPKQQALRNGMVWAEASADEEVTYTTTGSVRIAGGRPMEMVSSTATGGPGIRTIVSLTFTRSENRRVAKALVHRKKVRASIQVVAKDSAGNTSTATRGVAIKLAGN